MNVDIKTKFINTTKIEYPNQTPSINGIVFFIPKLNPEKDATALFGPGVYPKVHEIPINKNISGCIKKTKLLEDHFPILGMDGLI